MRTAVAETAGDVLVFLPGEREIRGVQRILEAALPSAIKVLPLFGALPLEQQREAVSADASGARRIILSTTIAESSLTIEGVRAVVDWAAPRRTAATGMAGCARCQSAPPPPRSAPAAPAASLPARRTGYGARERATRSKSSRSRRLRRPTSRRSRSSSPPAATPTLTPSARCRG